MKTSIHGSPSDIVYANDEPNSGQTLDTKMSNGLQVARTLIFWVLRSRGYTDMCIQIGNGAMVSNISTQEGISVEYFRFRDSLLADIMNADLVISHAGAGSCLEILEAGKPLVVVINQQLMGNHQLELAKQLHADEHLYYSTCENLKSVLENMNLEKLKPFPHGNAGIFAAYLNSVFGFNEYNNET
ncbi:UDP-N-acetylglucosamine transferase subunit ALG13 homolog isoform X2 [Schistocerca serialis cubense]|uniref:UDP-N-acetylglucosamine transferase subunit ALG13 homolog isoform X2 n=1 Tax=Schistocerca serialis cubense TaxID=2023355 RepID=UPI00214E47C8|nr:UDP-N-acetylglucosamine transferase subunit ALG13 homolog isoform X2 [Schistocerca serialis cubense]